MANNSQKAHETAQTTQIIERDLKTELSKSYIDYAMSVIVGRAIPDARDGLKPVQRRILYSMAVNNFYHNHAHRKCATIVGHVIGHYHPHGDSAVYEAMVRMGQKFSLRYMLIDGQGNFGSIDGDPAAAYRYTEARLTRMSGELLEDIDKETVDFRDTYDNSEQEPTCLPAKLPNLLLNGSTGIAVGMSTNMAPHNLNEVGNAILAALEVGPENLTLALIEKHIKGPDFPTGGIIMGTQGVRNAIHTGRGNIVIRSRTEIVANGAGKNKDAIIITEIPYMVNKAQMIVKMAELVNKGVLKDISDIRDESDRKGIRVVIELKRNSDANANLNQLFQRTKLQSSFNIINLALVNRGLQPQVLNYAEILQEFIAHREEVITRRTQFYLRKAEKRLEIIKGLLIAIANIDEVVQLIKKSQSAATASSELQAKFALTELQASEILKMQLSRLTNLQTQKLGIEQGDLETSIKRFEEILADRKERLNIIKAETVELMNKYGDERRSEIIEMAGSWNISVAETVPEEDCVIMITMNQAIKRMTLETYQSQRRGGKGKKGMKIREEDMVQEMFIASSRDTILLFTSKGRVYAIPAFKIPLGSRTSQGKAIINYVNLAPGETVVDITSVSNFDEERFLILVSAKGTTKKMELMHFNHIRKTGIICMNVRTGDELVRAKICSPGDNICIATKNGYAARFLAAEIRPTGRSAMGVKGITLRVDTDEVVDMVVGGPDSLIITITKLGYGKVSKLKLYRLIHRGGKGVINIKLRSERDGVIAVKAVPIHQNLLLASTNGNIIRIPTGQIRETGRAAKGVIVMKLKEGDEVSGVALCELEDEVCDVDSTEIIK